MKTVARLLKRFFGKNRTKPPKERDDIPTDASQIKIVGTPVGYIRAHEELMRKLLAEQAGKQ